MPAHLTSSRACCRRGFLLRLLVWRPQKLLHKLFDLSAAAEVALKPLDI